MIDSDRVDNEENPSGLETDVTGVMYTYTSLKYIVNTICGRDISVSGGSYHVSATRKPPFPI